MDKVTYTKTTLYNFFRFNLFTKTEIYSELSGEEKARPIQVFLKPDYYDKEFDISKDKKEG